jgi:hypothetical protein
MLHRAEIFPDHMPIICCPHTNNRDNPVESGLFRHRGIQLSLVRVETGRESNEDLIGSLTTSSAELSPVRLREAATLLRKRKGISIPSWTPAAGLQRRKEQKSRLRIVPHT